MIPPYHLKRKRGHRNAFTTKTRRKVRISAPIAGRVCITTVDNTKICDVFFLRSNTHDYRDCPMMHQYIREQADALAQRRGEEYQQPLELGGYEIPRQVPSYQGPLFRGGDQMKVDQSLVRDLLRKKPKNRKYPPSQE